MCFFPKMFNCQTVTFWGCIFKTTFQIFYFDYSIYVVWSLFQTFEIHFDNNYLQILKTYRMKCSSVKTNVFSAAFLMWFFTLQLVTAWPTYCNILPAFLCLPPPPSPHQTRRGWRAGIKLSRLLRLCTLRQYRRAVNYERPTGAESRSFFPLTPVAERTAAGGDDCTVTSETASLQFGNFSLSKELESYWECLNEEAQLLEDFYLSLELGK